MTAVDEPIETCAECGFDGATLQPADAVVALRSLARRWQELTHAAEPAVLVARPAPGVWSAAEYAAHSAIITGFWHHVLHRALTEPGPSIEVGGVGDRDAPATGEADTSIEIGAMLTDLAKHAEAMAAEAEHVNPSDWSRPATVNGQAVTALYALRHAVHDATHHLRDVDRGLRLLGASEEY